MDSSVNKPIKEGIPFNGIKPVSTVLFGGLLLFFLFEYVRPGSYFPVLEAAKLNTVIPVAVFVFTFFSNAGRSNLAVINARNTKWLLFFLFLFPIQSITADVTLYVYNAFKAIVGYLLIYFVIVKQVTDMQRIKAVFSVLVFIHVLLVILNPNVVLAPEARNYIAGVTFLGDGNDFAWSVCIVVPLALYLFQISEGRLKKIFFFSAFCLLILTVVGTQSRGGSIALGATILYLVLRGRKKAVGLIGLGALIVLVAWFAPQVYFDRMKTVADYKTEGSAQGRIMAWKSAVRMATDYPFIGVGAGHFGVKYGVEYRPPGVGRREIPWSNAHSIYFLALGEFGFTGLVILLGIIVSNLIRNEKRIRSLNKQTSHNSESARRLTVAVQSSFIGFIVGGAFLSGLYYPHLFILTTLCEATDFVDTGANQNKR